MAAPSFWRAKHAKRPLWAMLNGETVRWWIATLATPLVLGLAAHEFQKSENERADKARASENERADKARAENARRDAEARADAERRTLLDKRLTLYTELLSKREQADTEVRRGIFDKVLEKYLQPDAKNIGNKIVALDLMSANFHDSLDLSPLFWQLDHLASSNANTSVRAARLKELARIAYDVKLRQLDALTLAGGKYEFVLRLAQEPGVTVPGERFDLQFDDPLSPVRNRSRRSFLVQTLEPDPQLRRVRIRVVVDPEPDSDKGKLDFVLWADLYDFPLVTFTRISATERFAVVLLKITPSVEARMALVYYPSARSGVKDKPFVDEVLENLVKHP